MSHVLREDADGICLLTLNRPDRRNALAAATIDELLAAFAAADADPAVRVVILTGAGSTFCAGGDLQDGLTGGGGVVAGHRQRGRFAELLATIRQLRVPVIAAVNGKALGGGCGLAAACDLVVADAGAEFGTPEIKVGLFPWIILAVLQRDVPRKVLLEAALTGQSWSAERARELGLVNRVAPAGGSVAEARALAATVASRSAAVVGLGKRAFHAIADLGLDPALAYMTDQLTLNLLTEDAMEGIVAFTQGRAPAWKDR
ncbi:MAG: enoyl-CoA hydratase-related protein [Myxococcota bacterium]